MNNTIDKILIILVACTFIIPGFQSIDQLYPEFLYLSIVQGLILLYLLFLKNINYLTYFKNHSVLFFLSFLVIGLLSFFQAINKQETFIEILYYFTYFITFINAFILFKDKPFKFYTSLITVMLFVESGKVIYEFLKIYDFNNPVLRSPLYAGFSSNVNVTAFSMLMKVPILLYVITVDKEKNIFKNGVLYLILLITTFSIFLCYSRGAIISLLIISIIYIVYLLKEKNSLPHAIIYMLILCSTYGSNKILLQNANSDIIVRASTLNLNEENSSLNYRLGYYLDALKGAYEKPILGWGLGNWKIVSIHFAKNRMKEYQVGYHVHNDFLQIMAETGIIGGLMYIMFLFSPLLLFFKKYKKMSHTQKRIFFFLTLMFLVFFIDSNLNFPRARPTSLVNICLLVAVSYHQIRIMKNE